MDVGWFHAIVVSCLWGICGQRYVKFKTVLSFAYSMAVEFQYTYPAYTAGKLPTKLRRRRSSIHEAGVNSKINLKHFYGAKDI